MLLNPGNSVPTTRHHEALDSLLHTRGLSLPTFKQRDWFMHHPYGTSSSACIAGTGRALPKQKRFDFLTRYCGLCPPTLSERIGIMAADGQRLPTRFHTAHQRYAGRPALSPPAGSPAGLQVKARPRVKTPPTGVASALADGQAGAMGMRVGNGFNAPIDPAKTTPTAIASGPHERLDN